MLFEVCLDLKGPPEAKAWSTDSLADIDEYVDAFHKAKLAFIRKCDYCGRSTEEYCCTLVTSEDEWDLL